MADRRQALWEAEELGPGGGGGRPRAADEAARQHETPATGGGGGGANMGQHSIRVGSGPAHFRLERQASDSGAIGDGAPAGWARASAWRNVAGEGRQNATLSAIAIDNDDEQQLCADERIETAPKEAHQAQVETNNSIPGRLGEPLVLPFEFNIAQTNDTNGELRREKSWPAELGPIECSECIISNNSSDSYGQAVQLGLPDWPTTTAATPTTTPTTTTTVCECNSGNNRIGPVKTSLVKLSEDEGQREHEIKRARKSIPRDTTISWTIKSFVGSFRIFKFDYGGKFNELRVGKSSSDSDTKPAAAAPAEAEDVEEEETIHEKGLAENCCEQIGGECHVYKRCFFGPLELARDDTHDASVGGIRASISFQSCLRTRQLAYHDQDCVSREVNHFDRPEFNRAQLRPAAGHAKSLSSQERRHLNKSMSSNIIKAAPIEQQGVSEEKMANRSGNIARNRYLIEDKIRKQLQEQQQHNQMQRQRQDRFGSTRLEDRRSTYCSSVGAITSDLNYDSSLSSGANCSSELIMQQQCSLKGGLISLNENNKVDRKKLNKNKQIQDDDGHSGGSSSAHDQCNLTIDTNNNSNNNKSTGNNSQGAKKTVGKTTIKKRENWDKNIEFLLAVIGFAVDLGNVWRFPYICYKNGGGAFLIPYTIMFILGGLPIFYLEMSLGQYFSSGCLTVWRRVCPMAKGIGYAMCVLNFFTGLYYNTIISWAVFFFVESFTYDLPWTSCNNLWNSPDCKTIEQRQETRTNLTYNPPTSSTSMSNDPFKQSPANFNVNQTQEQLVHFSSPTKDYFEREVLQVHLSSGIDDLGSIRKPLAIYLAIVFICIYFAIWKGVKSTGKAVWITALLPYFVLIPLLVRGVFLEGAWLGIKYYLYPEWIKIIDVDVWVEAAKQIYFSLGPGFGTLMALSSYNKFNHNCRRDALIAASVNYFASFISGLVIFAVLGYMATIENVSIEEVATEGPGLVFQVYPEALATMRFSAMWSVLFFIMVITLGIDSTFGGLESVITGLCDEYPRVLRAHRGIFIGLLIILIYLCSLPTTTYGGNYVIYVLESYGTSLSLLFIVLIETIIICWLYGADKFCKNLQEMYGELPGAYWRICWKYISPSILLLIFTAACGQELDKYHTLKNGNYTYPGWAPTVGLLMTGSSVCCVPIYAIYYVKTKTSGTFLERLKMASRPIEGNQKDEKDRYADAHMDKIRDHNDIHLDTDI